MTLEQCFTYFGQLLNACWGAFQLEIWGIAIWQILAAIMLLSLTVKFLKRIFNTDTNSGGDNPSND